MKITHLIASLTAAFAVMASASAQTAAGVAKADADRLVAIAQANLAEVATGKIALEKSQNAEVKSFAQMMIDDHTKALADTKTLATAKGVDLPDGPDMLHKAAALKLRALSGDTFDASYVKQSGVADHVATEKLLKKTQTGAKDGDLKALATQMLPVVQGHLKHARELPMKK